MIDGLQIYFPPENHPSRIMKLLVNNKTVVMDRETSIEQLLKIMRFNRLNGIALAVNNKVIPRSDFADFALKENDSILIIRATQGG